MKEKKIKTFIFIIISLAVIFSLSVCNDDIFYQISQEIELKDPTIKGSPTNLVIFNKRIYVASGERLYSYNYESGADKKKRWSKETLKYDSKTYSVGQLAATDSYLYALCYRDEDNEIEAKLLKGKLIDSKNTIEWEDPWNETDAEFNLLQSIYSANNILYIGAQKKGHDSYAVHTIDSTGINIDIFKGEKQTRLNGVAIDSADVFLCTESGIYTNNGNDFNPISTLAFNGIYTLPDNKIVATTRSGYLYSVEKTEVKKITNLPENRHTTGAIALWQEGNNKLLLVGQTDIEYSTSTGHTYGYMELKLDENGDFPADAKFTAPGIGTVSTVSDNKSYSSSMGAIPVNHLLQVPDNIDPEMPIFASTQKEGVWSCKTRDSGKKQERIWNAED